MLMEGKEEGFQAPMPQLQAQDENSPPDRHKGHRRVFSVSSSVGAR